MSWLPLWLRRLFRIDAAAPDRSGAGSWDAGTAGASHEGREIAPSRPVEVQRVSAMPTDLPDDARAIAVLGQFRDELKSHHAVQSELATLIRDLHAPMRALPELARQHGGLMETLVDQAGRHRSRDQAIERSLHQLTEGAARQTQVLGLVQQQLDLNHETSIRVSDSLRDTASALGAFAATTDRQTRALEALAESTRRRLAQSERLERTLQFWLLVVSGLATLILLYALWAAMRVPPTPPARPEVVSAEGEGIARQPGTAVTPPPTDASSAPSAAPSTPSAVVTSATGNPPAPDNPRAVQAPATPPRPATAPAATAPSPASTIP